MASQSQSEIDRRNRWAFLVLLEQVSLERMRLIIQTHLNRTSVPLRRVANEAGIATWRMREFMAGATLTPEEWEVVKRWCTGMPCDLPMQIERVALGILIRATPGQHADHLRKVITRAIRNGNAEVGFTLPSWFEQAINLP